MTHFVQQPVHPLHPGASQQQADTVAWLGMFDGQLQGQSDCPAHDPHGAVAEHDWAKTS